MPWEPFLGSLSRAARYLERCRPGARGCLAIAATECVPAKVTGNDARYLAASESRGRGQWRSSGVHPGVVWGEGGSCGPSQPGGTARAWGDTPVLCLPCPLSLSQGLLGVKEGQWWGKPVTNDHPPCPQPFPTGREAPASQSACPSRRDWGWRGSGLLWPSLTVQDWTRRDSWESLGWLGS